MQQCFTCRYLMSKTSATAVNHHTNLHIRYSTTYLHAMHNFRVSSLDVHICTDICNCTRANYIVHIHLYIHIYIHVQFQSDANSLVLFLRYPCVWLTVHRISPLLFESQHNGFRLRECQAEEVHTQDSEWVQDQVRKCTFTLLIHTNVHVDVPHIENFRC